MTFNRKSLFISLTLLLILALPIFIVLVQRNQENRSRANAATTLSLNVSSPTTPISVNDPITVTLTANPGTTNILSVVSFVITYDKTKVAPAASPFILNPALTGWQAVIPAQVNATLGTISGTYSVGTDPTRAIQNTVPFGTLSFTAISGTEGQTTSIGFANTSTVYSLGSTDTANENVLSTTTPAQFSIASTVLPTATPTPDGQACLAVITYAVLPSTGECKQYGSSCIPDGWQTVDECPTAQMHPVTWSTNLVSLQADDFYISQNGQNFFAPTTTSIVSDPLSSSTPEKTTLEVKWIENGKNMKLKFYFMFPTENNFWKLGGIETNSDVGTVQEPNRSYNFTDEFNQPLQHSLGETVVTPSIYFTRNSFPYPSGTTQDILKTAPYRIYFKNLRLQAFKGYTPPVSPTPVIIDDTAYLAINLGLHGIGYAGDNAGPGRQVSFSPSSPAPSDAPARPINATRSASVQFYDAQNQLIHSMPTTLQFSPDTYAFGNILPLSSQAVTALAGKTVSIRISMPKYLTTFYPLITIRPNGTTNLPYTAVIAGNVYNTTANDNQIDILDYNAIMDCREDVDAVNKAGTCSVDADANDDGRVDVLDYQLLIRELSVQNGR